MHSYQFQVVHAKYNLSCTEYLQRCTTARSQEIHRHLQ